MTHGSMIAAQALSGDLLGATGDQSFGEAVSGDKTVVYECLSHKTLLRSDYYSRLEAIDPECKEVFKLMENAETDADYQRLETLLTPEIKPKLKSANERFREASHLVEAAATAAMPESLPKAIQKGKVNPHHTYGGPVSALEQALRAGHFEVVEHVLKHSTSQSKDRHQFCKIFASKDRQGGSFLSKLRRDKPGTASTDSASYMVTLFLIEQYKFPLGSKRDVMQHAFVDLIKTFNALGKENYDEKALIGLMLLTTKNIANEYRFMSPRKGMFFGSRFYSILETALAELGVDLKTLTPAQRQEYYQALANVIEREPQFLANEYILKSLSQEANIRLPKVPPLLTDAEAKKLLESPTSSSDPTVLRTQSGIYKTHAAPMARGGWGAVYAARHYSLPDGQLKVSTPLAIKVMPGSNQSVMDKEARLFKQAFPEGHFEQFTQNGNTYLAMPLFPGVPLDDYLREYPQLPNSQRKQITKSLLESLKVIHANGVVHNDIKPKNMLYDPVNKTVHIVDFGCAESTGARMRFADINTAKFAIEYMPPEYLDGCGAQAQLDLYSMTLTLAEILGANKQALVKARMEAALEYIDDDDIKASITKAFNATGSLDEALFTSEVAKHWNKAALNDFISHYVKASYDFTPYQTILGDDNIALLNSLQANAANRPSIEDAIATFQPQPTGPQARV